MTEAEKRQPLRLLALVTYEEPGSTRSKAAACGLGHSPACGAAGLPDVLSQMRKGGLLLRQQALDRGMARVRREHGIDECHLAVDMCDDLLLGSTAQGGKMRTYAASAVCEVGGGSRTQEAAFGRLQAADGPWCGTS